MRASESRRPRAPPPASLSPSRKQVEPTSARAFASVVVTVTQASESQRPRVPPPAPLLLSCEQVEPASARASASVDVTITRASESRRPHAPPPALSSLSRKREPKSSKVQTNPHPQQTLRQEGGNPAPHSPFLPPPPRPPTSPSHPPGEIAAFANARIMTSVESE